MSSTLNLGVLNVEIHSYNYKIHGYNYEFHSYGPRNVEFVVRSIEAAALWWNLPLNQLAG